MKLDNRLTAVATLVRTGKRIADIGTDHAYLPVWLVQEGICPTAIASDCKTGPLAAARRHVTEAGLADRISLRLGDGLTTVKPQEADDIVIAGMGGETIAAILENAPWVADAEKRLILQPMTRAEDTRRWLLQHGFSIECEHLVKDGRREYTVMAAQYAALPCREDEVLCYGGAFSAGEGADYRRRMAAHLRRKANGVSDSPQAEKWNSIADILEQEADNS